MVLTGKKAYYGGEARCEEQAAQADDYDPSELVCGACSDVSRAQVGKRDQEQTCEVVV